MADDAAGDGLRGVAEAIGAAGSDVGGGLSAAVRKAQDTLAAAAVNGRPDLGGAEQLALLPSVGALADPDGEGAVVVPLRNPKGGRPRGSPNRSTREWTDYILGRYRSPLIFLAETFNRPVALLAQELGCSKFEAFQLQQKAAAELAPFVHQKQPTAVQLDTTATMVVLVADARQLAELDGAEASIDGEATVLAPDAIENPADPSVSGRVGGPQSENQQNQQVSDAENAPSDNRAAGGKG